MLWSVPKPSVRALAPAAAVCKPLDKVAEPSLRLAAPSVSADAPGNNWSSTALCTVCNPPDREARASLAAGRAWSAPAANWLTASGSCADGSRAVANAVTSLCSCVAAVERLLIGSAKQPSNSCWLSASRLWNASVLIKACCADCKDAKPLPSVCKSPATACIASVVAVPLLETELFKVSMPVCNCSKPADKVLICAAVSSLQL